MASRSLMSIIECLSFWLVSFEKFMPERYFIINRSIIFVLSCFNTGITKSFEYKFSIGWSLFSSFMYSKNICASPSSSFFSATNYFRKVLATCENNLWLSMNLSSLTSPFPVLLSISILFKIFSSYANSQIEQNKNFSLSGISVNTLSVKNVSTDQK